MMIRLFSSIALATGVLTGCAKAEDAAETQRVAPERAPGAVVSADGCWKRGASVAGRPSAFDSVTASLAGKTLKLCYSRPQMKGRTIMGGLVPYAQPWRLGANEATSIIMPARGTIAGVPVEAGVYSLYVVPGEAEWEIVVNRNAQRWGVPIDAGVRANDVGSGKVKTESVSEAIETFTARFDQVTNNAAVLVLEWEHTRVRVPVTLQ